MGPYKIIEEDEAHVTYEYRAAYTWTLYAGLLVFMVGSVLPNELLSRLGLFVALGNLVAKIVMGRAIESKIRTALKSSTVQITGSRMSFGNPLKIRVSK